MPMRMPMSYEDDQGSWHLVEEGKMVEDAKSHVESQTPGTACEQAFIETLKPGRKSEPRVPFLLSADSYTYVCWFERRFAAQNRRGNEVPEASRGAWACSRGKM